MPYALQEEVLSERNPKFPETGEREKRIQKRDAGEDKRMVKAKTQKDARVRRQKGLGHHERSDGYLGIQESRNMPGGYTVTAYFHSKKRG